jgi:peptidoglycan/LPS O-acetylase OafA/YrhL
MAIESGIVHATCFDTLPVALSHVSEEPASRIPELDGIRGLAILLVVAWHYVAAPLASVPAPLAQLAWRSLRLAGGG